MGLDVENLVADVIVQVIRRHGVTKFCGIYPGRQNGGFSLLYVSSLMSYGLDVLAHDGVRHSSSFVPSRCAAQ